MFVTNMFVYGEIMPTQPTSPSSRRNRPAKPALTREGIVSTAVEILRSEGLQKLTMRRLALELDTGPASMYVYVRNTVELHAAVLDELLGVVDLAENSSGTWQARLERVLTSYTAVLFDHPGLAQSALVSRPSGVHYVRLLERLLALLDEGEVLQVRPRGGAWTCYCSTRRPLPPNTLRRTIPPTRMPNGAR